MFTKKEIREEISLSKSLLTKFRKEADKLPEGKLYLKKGHGKYRTYQRVNGQERYLGSKKAAIVRGLEDKEKLEHSIGQLERNVTLLSRMETEYISITDLMPDRESLAAGAAISLQRQGILMSGEAISPPRQGALMSRQEIEEIAFCWQENHNGNTDYIPEGRIHRTSDGICVRSKSELVIYEYLKSHGIAFVYERPLQVIDHWRYPDFTLIRKSDGKVFIWEHLGRMSDPQYHRKNIDKIYEYMADDYLPFRDILFSYDYEDGSIDLWELDRMLRAMGFID